MQLYSSERQHHHEHQLPFSRQLLQLRKSPMGHHPSLIIIFCFFFCISQTPTCNRTTFLNHNMITHHPSPITFFFFFISQTPPCNLTTFLNHNMITHDHPSTSSSASSSCPSYLKTLQCNCTILDITIKHHHHHHLLLLLFISQTPL